RVGSGVNHGRPESGPELRVAELRLRRCLRGLSGAHRPEGQGAGPPAFEGPLSVGVNFYSGGPGGLVAWHFAVLREWNATLSDYFSRTRFAVRRLTKLPIASPLLESFAAMPRKMPRIRNMFPSMAPT